MFTLVISLIVIVCVLLVLIILAQNPKGGGLSSQFGGSGASNLIGVKKTGDLLERLTWGFAITLFVLSMATNFIIPSNTGTGLNSPNIDRAEEQQQTPELDLEGIQEESQPSDNSSLEDLLEGDSTK
ncbi:MAG TPA: preprotein translocase subunit SecG [Cyclobacteriaceae bacterium]|jgi:preprotein translocase subunit SecG